MNKPWLASAFFFYCISGLGQASSSTCVHVTVATEDTLKNIKMGLDPNGEKWFTHKLEKYPNVCYVAPNDDRLAAILFIAVTPATYHGTKQVEHTTTVTSPTNLNDNRTVTSEENVPYTVQYGIFTLTVQRVEKDHKLMAVHIFQQEGLYSMIYGIPLGGRGHHPAHAVLEDAAKWLNAGGLSDPNQWSNLGIR